MRVTVRVNAAYEGMNPSKPIFLGGNLRETFPIECNNKIIDITKQSKNVKNKNNVAIENQEDEVNRNWKSTTTGVWISPGNPPCHQTAKGKSGRQIIAKKLIIIATEFKYTRGFRRFCSVFSTCESLDELSNKIILSRIIYSVFTY